MKRILLVVAVALFNNISAEVIPPVSNITDDRIRTINYTRDVIKLNTLVGVSSHIEFGNDEFIEFLASGDDEAWHFAPKKNHLFIRPVATDFVDTNLTVLTNKNTYHFVLVQNDVNEKDWEKAWEDKNLIYSLKFKYPEEEQRLFAEAQAEKRREQNENRRIQQLQAEKVALRKELDKHEERYLNKSYWGAGDREIAPKSTYDDGTFTFLEFEPNQVIPAIYAVNKHGQEAIVNTTMVGKNAIKIQGVYSKVYLRNGDSVMCIDNRGFSVFEQTGTNTTSPNVIRVTKKEI